MDRLNKDLVAKALKAAAGQQDPKPGPRQNTTAADYFRRLEPPLNLIDRNELDDRPALVRPPRSRQRPPAVLVPANKRPDRTLPSRLGMAERTDNRTGRLFTPASHADPSGQMVLPGFGVHITMPTPALPLALYDLGVGDSAERRGRGAPLALRLWIEAVLSVPLDERRRNEPVALEVTLRELLARLYPGGWPSPARYWPRLMAAVQALSSPQAFIPWEDPETGEGGLQRVVQVSRIPRGPGALDDRVRVLVDLPPGADDGPIVSPNLAWWGVKAAAPYRALIGLAFRWWNPGITRYPVRRGEHWVQRHDLAAYGDPLTDNEAIALCFPTSTRAQRRNLVYEARRVLKGLVDAGETRLIEGRLLPPGPPRRKNGKSQL